MSKRSVRGRTWPPIDIALLSEMVETGPKKIMKIRVGARFIMPVALGAPVLVPWPTLVESGALLRPSLEFQLQAPAHAQITALPFAEGARVAAGQPLIHFSAPETNRLRAKLDAQIDCVHKHIGTDQRSASNSLRELLLTLQVRLDRLKGQEASYAPRAPFAGVLRDIEPGLAPGVWVAKDERVAVLVGEGAHEVSSYLDEKTVSKVVVGDSAHFYSEGLAGPVLRLKVASIEGSATRVLPGGQWASAHGGSVKARVRNGIWYPENAVYRVGFTVEEPVGALADSVWRGRVVINGRREAPAVRFIRALAALLKP